MSSRISSRWKIHLHRWKLFVFRCTLLFWIEFSIGMTIIFLFYSKLAKPIMNPTDDDYLWELFEKSCIHSLRKSIYYCFYFWFSTFDYAKTNIYGRKNSESKSFRNDEFIFIVFSITSRADEWFNCLIKKYENKIGQTPTID